MKKLLLIVSAALISMSALAFEKPVAEYVKSEAVPATDADAAHKVPGEGTMTVQYSGDYVGGIGFNQKSTVHAAIQFPEELQGRFVGNQVTKVRIALGTLRSTTTMKIWIKRNLEDATPLYSEEVTITKKDGWGEYTLKTPFDIDGKNFYVGYTVDALGKQGISGKADSPIGVDGAPAVNDYSDYIAIDEDGTTYWGHMYEFGVDYNVCIGLVVSGKKMPQTDVAVQYADVNFTLQQTSYDYVLTAPNREFKAICVFVNQASQPISNYEVSYQIGNAEPEVGPVKLSTPLPFGKASYFTISGKVDYEALNIPIKITITKVNGVEDETPADNTAITYVNSVKGSYDRTPVIEEITGTWCGWCPRGYVGMEYMKENYPDCIGIAVHVSDDMMYYDYAAGLFAGGAPMAFIDRSSSFDPNSKALEQYYLRNLNRQAIASIAIKDVKIANGKATVTVGSKVVLDSDAADFRVAFALVEDNVGPYVQSNYYSKDIASQSGAGYLEGWTEAAEKVSVKFNDVARYITEYNGKVGSVPATVKADQEYTYTETVDLSKVKDLDKMTLVALLVDGKSGEIANAAKWNSSNAGISDTVVDAEEVSTTYVDLLGRPVANPANGIYVKVVTYSDGTVRTSKVAVK